MPTGKHTSMRLVNEKHGPASGTRKCTFPKVNFLRFDHQRCKSFLEAVEKLPRNDVPRVPATPIIFEGTGELASKFETL